MVLMAYVVWIVVMAVPSCVCSTDDGDGISGHDADGQAGIYW